MRIFDFLLPRHRRYAEFASAYADGELRGGELRRFEVHLEGCAECQAAVADARALRQAITRLPEVPAPRSFRLTPEMVAGPVRKQAPVRGGTPLYLGFARAGAAVAVGAFAVVVAMSALDSKGENSAADAGTREIALTAADDAGANAAQESTTDRSAAPEAAPTATPAPAIAPASGGGASGAGVATAAASPTTRVADPQPPATGAQTPTDMSTEYNTDQNVPKAGGDALEPVPGVTSFEPYREGGAADDDGNQGLIIGLGALAAVSVLLLGGLELRRRAG